GARLVATVRLAGEAAICPPRKPDRAAGAADAVLAGHARARIEAFAGLTRARVLGRARPRRRWQPGSLSSPVRPRPTAGVPALMVATWRALARCGARRA